MIELLLVLLHWVLLGVFYFCIIRIAFYIFKDFMLLF